MEQTEHDLLIKLNTKVNIMCSTIANFQKDNHDQHQEIINCINKKIDTVHNRVNKSEDKHDKCREESIKRTDTKLDTQYFKWVFRSIIAIFIIGTIFSTTNIISNNDRFNKIETKISILHNDQPEHLFEIPEK